MSECHMIIVFMIPHDYNVLAVYPCLFFFFFFFLAGMRPSSSTGQMIPPDGPMGGPRTSSPMPPPGPQVGCPEIQLGLETDRFMHTDLNGDTYQNT